MEVIISRIPLTYLLAFGISPAGGALVETSLHYQIWRFWPLVSVGGSDKLLVIDLAGALKVDGSLSPCQSMLGAAATSG